METAFETCVFLETKSVVICRYFKGAQSYEIAFIVLYQSRNYVENVQL